MEWLLSNLAQLIWVENSSRVWEAVLSYQSLPRTGLGRNSHYSSQPVLTWLSEGLGTLSNVAVATF